ncbi:DUF3618 domain-containing protein [Streptomyces sp. NBC_01310]|uniref:DUF3618 domain-containing protein n=1 Tax=Streptomyces sp. NBC_01310 TaxID=2903820 RepID=UPI0035B69301|nr:DUF3618 domain-containing protein [Streptomyces sp. NBC_01310]
MNDDARINIGTPAPTPAGPGSAELRDQVERTRDELGRTVEALAAKTDIKAQAKEKTAAVKGQAAETAALVSEQIREKTGHAVQLVKAKTPDPLLEKTAQAAVHVREGAAKAGQYATDKTPDPLLEKAGQAATAARANRTPLLVAGAAVVVFLLVRRHRGRRR